MDEQVHNKGDGGERSINGNIVHRSGDISWGGGWPRG